MALRCPAGIFFSRAALVMPFDPAATKASTSLDELQSLVIAYAPAHMGEPPHRGKDLAAVRHTPRLSMLADNSGQRNNFQSTDTRPIPRSNPPKRSRKG